MLILASPGLALALLDAGYGPDVACAFGTIPLMVACDYSGPSAPVIEALLGRGADPRRTNQQGYRAADLIADEVPQQIRGRVTAADDSSRPARRTMADGAAGP